MMNNSRLNVISLILEITRKCNLKCKHCFRGNSEKVYMDLDLIDIIFNEVCRINEFLLTGGEPFLAKKQLERITNNIMKDRTNIGKMIIVTNGTVMSYDILGMLHEINKRTNLEIRLSNDVFHIDEIEKKKLVEIRNDNIQRLKEYFNVYIPEDKVFVIDKIGRASNLNEDDLNKINNRNISTKYVFGTDKSLDSFRNNYLLPSIIDNNVVDGSLNIDVYGNITPVYYSYIDEDKSSLSNINNAKSLKLAISKINKMKD